MAFYFLIVPSTLVLILNIHFELIDFQFRGRIVIYHVFVLFNGWNSRMMVSYYFLAFLFFNASWIDCRADILVEIIKALWFLWHWHLSYFFANMDSNEYLVGLIVLIGHQGNRGLSSFNIKLILLSSSSKVSWVLYNKNQENDSITPKKKRICLPIFWKLLDFFFIKYI